MSNVSIYDKSWLDLVFDGKNKEYGAYQLRQQNPRTTLLALFMGIGFFAGIAGVGTLISSFSSGDAITKPIIPDSPPIEVTEINLGDKPEIEKPKPAAAAPQTFDEPVNLANMVVAQTAEAVAVPTNETMAPSQPSGETNGTGIVPNTESGGGTAVTATTTNITNDTPVGTDELDRMPLFPGGIDKFYTYIISNIRNPEDVSEDETSVKVLMSFVVEKDGSMTDIKVLKSSNYSLEKEAIRVLKSLRTKWAPGIKDHEKVRTLYKLPITVTL